MMGTNLMILIQISRDHSFISPETHFSQFLSHTQTEFSPAPSLCASQKHHKALRDYTQNVDEGDKAMRQYSDIKAEVANDSVTSMLGGADDYTP